jgi:hypothetical protein
MTKLKIKVTEENIRNGQAYSTLFCPIALAIRDVLPDARVSSEFIVDDGYTIILPQTARDFILRFDFPDCHLSPASPFEFEIDIPDEIVDKINIEKLKNHPTLELINE